MYKQLLPLISSLELNRLLWLLVWCTRRHGIDNVLNIEEEDRACIRHGGLESTKRRTKYKLIKYVSSSRSKRYVTMPLEHNHDSRVMTRSVNRGV